MIESRILIMINGIRYILRYISPFEDMCSPNGTYLCMNGGVCEYDTLIEDVHCICPYKYKGKYCEIGKITLNYCLHSS